MLYLRTLGGLSLENEGKRCPGAAGQRAPLAILALIATAETGATRDRIASIFWPERDTERAHGSLKQALYALRRDAGVQDLLIGTSSLKLNSAVIKCDATEFLNCVASKDFKNAASLYSGDFLDGVHLTGNDEFERWVDRERSRLATAYAASVEALAARADESKNFSESVTWWRRLSIADPLSVRIARNYMIALARSGERNAALDHGERFQRLHSSELGAPAPAIARLSEDIRVARIDEVPIAAIAISPQVDSPRLTSAFTADKAAAPRNDARKGLATFGIFAIAVMAASWIWAKSTTSDPADQRLSALALIPCEEPARKLAQDSIGDRWTEELIDKLVNVGELRPKSFPSIARYRASSKTPRQIGGELNAGSIIRCRISEMALSIKLSLQLIRSADDNVIWSHEYVAVRGTEGVNSVQAEAALDIARVLRAEVPAATATAIKRPLTKDSVALRLYRLGRHFYVQGSSADMRKSADYFSKAIARDSSFARAYVGLADATSFVRLDEQRPATEWQPETERYLRKALSLDESIAEAHSSLALYYSDYAYDSISANREHLRSLQLDPASVDAHLWYGYDLFCWERPAEAIREYQRALELDPMQSLARMHLARVFIFGGQYQRARPYVDEAIELFPKATPDPYLLASILIGEGKKDSAVHVMDVATKEAWLGYLYGIAGRPDMTRHMLDSLTAESVRRNIDPIDLAVLQITLDRKDQAISSLEKGYAERSPNLRYVLGPHPAFNSIRADPRFKDLRRRVGYRQ